MHTQATAVAFQKKKNLSSEGLGQSRYPRNPRPRHPLIAVVLCAFCALFAFGSPTYAADQVRSYHFDITDQTLSQALRHYGQISGQEIIFTEELLTGLGTTTLKGDYTASAALNRLLQGTGLTAQKSPSGALMIRRPTQTPENSSANLNSAENPSFPTASQKPWWHLAKVDAQNKTDNPSTDSTESVEKPTKLDEIVVTAQKRAERQIDTPLSITVLNTDDLASRGAVQLRDFANTVPGLSFITHGAGVTKLIIRGVSAGGDVSPLTGVYVDDVAYGTSSVYSSGNFLALDVGLFDVDHIEVLRGPQGTLYGASAMGGLIKYITRKPDTQNFFGDTRLGVSGTEHGGVNYNVAATVNVPLVSNRVGARVSGFQSHDGGFIDNLTTGDNDVDQSNVYGGRIDLLFSPSDNLDVRLGVFAQNIARDGTVMADYTLAATPLDGSLNQHNPFNDVFNQRFRLVSGVLDYEFGPATLTSISSYQTVDSEWFLDRSVFFGPFLTGRGFPTSGAAARSVPFTDKFSQELRLASTGSPKLEWLIGAYYADERSGAQNDVLAIDLAGNRYPDNAFVALFTRSTYEDRAAFADVTYHFTSKFDATAGIRYAQNRQTYLQNGQGILGTSGPKRGSTDSVSTYLANARYKFNDSMTAYLRYATGYRPGGINTVLNDPVTGLPVAAPTFEPDELSSYEIGFKTKTHRFGLELASYYINWDDLQTVVISNGFGVIGNAARATVRGAELALTVRLTDDLTLTGNVGYQNAEMAEADPVSRARQGERIPHVPDLTAALNLDYALPAWSIHPTLGGTVRYVSDRTATYDAAFSPQYHFPDYTTVDVRAGFTFGPVDASLYVNNVFDERGQLSAFLFNSSRAGAGRMSVAIMQPRTIGISLSTKF